MTAQVKMIWAVWHKARSGTWVLDQLCKSHRTAVKVKSQLENHYPEKHALTSAVVPYPAEVGQ